MPRFIAVHTLPYTEDTWEESMKGAAEQLSKLPPGVQYNLTYCGLMMVSSSVIGRHRTRKRLSKSSRAWKCLMMPSTL